MMWLSHVLPCSVLLLVRVSIAAICGSLSIIVTTLDAVLDVISGFIIWSTSIAKRRKNKYKFPIGQVLPELAHVDVGSNYTYWFLYLIR